VVLPLLRQGQLEVVVWSKERRILQDMRKQADKREEKKREQTLKDITT